jgi:hypothetical protein
VLDELTRRLKYTVTISFLSHDGRSSWWRQALTALKAAQPQVSSSVDPHQDEAGELPQFRGARW